MWREPSRNFQLQQQIAEATSGQALEFAQLHSYLEQLTPEIATQTTLVRQSLWSLPAWFIILFLLLVSEWIGRRWIYLT